MHEPDSWQPLSELPLFIENDYSEAEKAYLDGFISRLAGMTTAQVTSKMPVFKKKYQSLLRFYAYKGSLFYSSISYKLPILIKTNPVRRLTKSHEQSAVITWKSIESLGRMPFMARNLAHANCIHIVRNPAGYIASVLNGESKSNFQSMLPSSEDYHLFEMLLNTKAGSVCGYTLDSLRQLTSVERLAIRWRLYNEIAYEGSKNLRNYKLLFYEDVCRNTEIAAKKLFKFCNLKWDKQTEMFVAKSISRNNEAYYSVYKSPLEAAYKWKTTLTPENILSIKSILSGCVPFSWYADDFEMFLK